MTTGMFTKNCEQPHAADTENKEYTSKHTGTGMSMALVLGLGTGLVLSTHMAECGPLKEGDSPGQRGHNENRSEIRQLSKTTSDLVLRSLQTCQIKENLAILQESEMRFNDPRRKQKMRGLQAVLMELTQTDSTGKCTSYLPFDDAFEMFMGYIDVDIKDRWDRKEWKKTFQDATLHDEQGLCVNIISSANHAARYLVLKSDDLDLTKLFSHLLSEDTKVGTSQLNKESVTQILNTMSTEWDKKCLKYVLSADKSVEDVNKLGIKRETVSRVLTDVPMVVDAIQNSRFAAEDIVQLRLRTQCQTIESRLSKNSHLLNTNRNRWPEYRILDLESDIEIDRERLVDVRKFQDPENMDKNDKRKLYQMVGRQQDHLIQENRLGLRQSTSQGRPALIDTEVEEIVAKAIEDKATYHGRRHNTVMFTNRRVKSRDLLAIANDALSKQGKRTIKSATTVWNRSAPRKINSVQAKLHLGKGLWCTKKPPKAEDSYNECTHHQRAHVSYIRNYLYSSKAQDHAKYTFMRSIDDKAYLRPGTGEAMANSRNTRILIPSAQERARKLPIHDWPEKKVCVTPSAHRIFAKEPKMINEKEVLLTKDDNHIVFLRPKYYVGSSGTTWSNETMDIRLSYPNLVEVDTDDSHHTLGFRQFAAKVHDTLFLWVDMAEASDYKKAISGEPTNKYTNYELVRIKSLELQLESAVQNIPRDMSDVDKQWVATKFYPKQLVLTESLQRLQTALESQPELDTITQEFESIKTVCSEILGELHQLNLPKVKPIWVDLTDAGPGVGVSNNEVKFREAELARAHRSEYRIRVHRSREDSGQNEAERTNSAIGDGIIDGGSLQWEYFPKFFGLPDEEIAKMTVQEFDEHEENRMMKNAWQVCEDVRDRLDGAPVLSEHIRSHLTPTIDESHFFNKAYVEEYFSLSGKNKCEVPGYSYMNKICDFQKQHFHIGELYLEYLKGDCLNIIGELCDYCQANPEWISPLTKRIPRPYPDVNNDGHYVSVFDAPFELNGSPRKIDDFQPRANIKSLVNEGQLDTEEQIKQFAKSFGVDADLVTKYMRHLTELELRKSMRSQQRTTEQHSRTAKTYGDYDWTHLVLTGKLSTLRVNELDKYMNHHKLNVKGKNKKEKVRMIVSHLKITDGSRETVVRTCDMVNDDETEHYSSDSSDSEEESEITGITATYSNESDDESLGLARQVTTTRSGRAARQFIL